MRDRSKRAGFSLIELVSVLVMIGLFIGIAMPRIDYRRARVDAAAMDLGSELVLAQRIAVLRQHDVRVSIDESARKVTIHYDTDNDGTVDADEQTRTEALGEGARFGLIGSALWGGSAVTFEKDAGGKPFLIFRRNGSASEEGVIHITTQAVVGNAYDRAVRVTRATGLARCWTRRSGTWTEGC